MNWQPIETAPKDGTWILTYTACEAHPTADMTHWVVKFGTADSGEECWIDQDDTETLNTNDPTHWMPLPPPPEAAK